MDEEKCTSGAANAPQVLDERLDETLRDWYPRFRTKPENEIKQAA
jgi:hypothetical protein